MMSTDAPRRRRTCAALLVAVAIGLGSGCNVERDRETEACIDEAMAQGMSTAEAQQECMSG